MNRVTTCARAAFADSRQPQHASQLLTNDAVVDYWVYARDNEICVILSFVLRTVVVCATLG